MSVYNHLLQSTLPQSTSCSEIDNFNAKQKTNCVLLHFIVELQGIIYMLGYYISLTLLFSLNHHFEEWKKILYFFE